MPKLYRKRVVKRRYGRKRSFKRGGKPGRAFSRKVKKVINSTAEKKYSQDLNSTANVSNVGLTYLFNGTLLNGTTNTTREGSEIYLRSLQIRSELYITSAATDIAIVRIIIGVWHDYQSTSPTLTKILESPTSGYQVSPLNRETLQAKRWTPMYDRLVTLMPRADSGTRLKMLRMNFAGKKLPHKKVSYSTASGAPNNVIFMFVLSGEVIAPFPVHICSWRYTFTDV